MKISIKLYCFFTLILFSITSFAFSGGSGTKEDPYLLRTCPELQSIINFPSEHFILADNINCNDFDYGDGGGFMPIGNQTYPFKGVLDGNGFTISYLQINRSKQNYVGLIGYLSGYNDTQGIIKNIRVVDSMVIGQNSVGGIVGYASTTGDTPFTNNYYEGVVSGNQTVGGVIGDSRVNISNSHADADVTTATNYAGGLVSYSYGDISNSSATGTVKSTSTTGEKIGGLVGWFTGGNGAVFEKNYANSVVTGYRNVGILIGETSYGYIVNSYAVGGANANHYAGGIIGYASNGTVTDSYVLGEIHADHYVAGLLGGTSGNITVTNSYAAAKVTGVMYAGGLIGYRNGGTLTVNSSYWDTIVSGQTFSAGGTPKTTAEMYLQETYVNWNFTNTWKINQGLDYPYLQ